MVKQSDLSITADSITREITVGNVSKKEEKSLLSFYSSFSKTAYFDTGILPLDGTGTLAIRKALGHTQTVFQFKPGKYLIIWGEREGSNSAKTYEVAQPYRIIIIDTMDDANGKSVKLIGARHFYSPVPVQTGDQILYHCNVPNLNCKGYRGTSVGWMCLYPTEDYGQYSFDNRLKQLIEKTSGAEAFNDSNMRSTDGARFYKNAGSPEYVWNPAAWEAKTKKDGVDWTLDSNLWIPVKVTSIDEQSGHDDKGIPLTLEAAMLGNYQAYYTDNLKPKPVNAFARSDLSDPTADAIYNSINQAFLQSTKKEVETVPIQGVKVKKLLHADDDQQSSVAAAKNPAPEAHSFALSVPAPVVNPVIGHCFDCSVGLHEEDSYTILYDGTRVCDECIDSLYGKCSECDIQKHFANLIVFDDTYYCNDCGVIYECPNCHQQYLNDPVPLIGAAGCIGCVDYSHCDNCHNKYPTDELHEVEAKALWDDDATGNYTLCDICLSESVICACGYLRKQTETGMVSGNLYACESCIQFKEDGMPFYASPEQYVQVSNKLVINS